MHLIFFSFGFQLFIYETVIMMGVQDLTGAIELATRVLQLKPHSFEAYHARARARRDDR